MSTKDEYKEYTEFKAPVTGWEVFLQFKYILAIVIVLVVSVVLIIYFQIKIEVPKILTYGIPTFVIVFGLTWWYLGLPEGWALNTLEMSEGWIGLKPLNRYQLERVAEQCIMFNSESGQVALVGHKLVAYDREGVLKSHPMLELQTNTEMVVYIAGIQATMMKEFLLLKSASELHSEKKFAEAYQAWRKKANLDPEVIMSLKQEPRFTD